MWRLGRLRGRGRSQSQYDESKLLTTNALREFLEEKIKERKGKSVKIDEESFYKSALYHLVEKKRDKDYKKSIISEKTHSFTNTESTNGANFEVTSTYEETTSLDVLTEKNHSVTVGGTMGWGLGGGNAGLKAQLSKGRHDVTNKGKSKAEIKDLKMSGEVKPEHTVTVKEITYILSSTTQGKLDIIVDRKTKIWFRYKGVCKKRGSIKMKNLLKAISPDMSAIDQSESRSVTIHMQAEWVYKTVMHALECDSVKLSQAHMTRIRGSYSSTVGVDREKEVKEDEGAVGEEEMEKEVGKEEEYKEEVEGEEDNRCLLQSAYVHSKQRQSSVFELQPFPNQDNT